MPKTCPSSLDNNDNDVDVDDDVFAALTMFVDIEERRRIARVSPMFPAGSFFGNISTKIFPTDFFTRNISTKILLHTLTVSLFLQEYFFSFRIFFTRNFYRQVFFSQELFFFSAKIFSLWIFSAMICRLQEMSLNFTRSLTFCRHGREYFSSHNEKGQNDRSAIWSGRELQAIPVLVQQARRQAGARIRSVFGAGGDNFCFWGNDNFWA